VTFSLITILPTLFSFVEVVSYDGRRAAVSIPLRFGTTPFPARLPNRRCMGEAAIHRFTPRVTVSPCRAASLLPIRLRFALVAK
jgi:hypothetical protein